MLIYEGFYNADFVEDASVFAVFVIGLMIKY